MRHKPYAKPELAGWNRSIDDPAACRGQWAGVFADPAKPLRLELGCGKGGFLAALALRDAGCNHLGVDIKNEMLVVAKRNIERLYGEASRAPDNVAITAYNIENIGNIVNANDKISRIYINFCNPWYKSGHAKHRLTHPRQLVKYRAFLQPGAELWFKTDDEPLFNDSLRYFFMSGFEVEWQTRDLHREEPDWNIRTEHETMFSAEGIPIKACRARMVEAKIDETAFLRMRDV